LFSRADRRGSGPTNDEDVAGTIHAVRLSDGFTKSLGIRGDEPHYVSPGYIVVASPAGALLAAPFDLSSVAVRGPLTSVQEGVLAAGRNLDRLPFAISDNGTLVYAQGTSSLVPSILDRSGVSHPFGAAGTRYDHPRLSPAADRAVVVQRDGQANDVYVFNRATGLSMRLTHDGHSHSPEWTPDGSRVAWLRTDSGRTALLWQRTDGSGTAETINTPDVELHRFVFAPNGKFIVAAIGPSVKHDLMIIPLDSSSKPRQLTSTPADEVGPSVSPDNQWVAYASNETGRYEVWIASIDHPETRIQVTTDGANSPVWRDATTLIASGNLSFVVTSLSFSPRVEIVKREPLARNYHHGGARDRFYDFNPKTGEFIVLTSATQQQNRIIVVTNWFEELKARFSQPAKP